MTSLKRVPRAVTEEALLLLQATYGDYLRESRSLRVGRGRSVHAGSRLGVHDSSSSIAQSCVLRMVSIVEAYLDVVVADLFDERTPGRHRLVGLLVESAAVQATSTWEQRQSAYETYHGVRLGELTTWDEIKAAVDARNAIAHGLGRLTRLQRRRNMASTFRKIDIELRDLELVVTPKAVLKCRDACVAFVRDLDEAIS